MKEINNISHIVGGRVSIESDGIIAVYDDSNYTKISIDSCFDRCILANPNAPQGTFTQAGYRNTNGDFYPRSGGDFDVIDLDTGLLYRINIGYSFFSNKTTYTISCI